MCSLVFTCDCGNLSYRWCHEELLDHLIKSFLLLDTNVVLFPVTCKAVLLVMTY